jgi:hypothetical protein
MCNSLNRECPLCKESITYKNIYYKNRAEKNGRPCNACRAKLNGVKISKEITLDKESVYNDYYIHEMCAKEIALKYGEKLSYIRLAFSKWGFTKELHARKLHDKGKRKCSKCSEIKNIKEFSISKVGIFGLNSQCGNCFKDSKTIYYRNEEHRAKERAKEWRENNVERARELANIKVRKSRKENPHLHRMKNLLTRFIRATKQNKTTRTTEMLGYGYDEFKNHILTFELPIHGNHVDHKCPISWFKNDVPANICNALDNLQVISENENEVKSQWWSHPINDNFFNIIKPWIKDEYVNRFILIKKEYIDIKSPYYE